MATTLRAVPGALDQRLREARDDPAYAAYRTAREAVLRMQELAPAEATRPSAYWRDELAGFEYLLDASPLLVASLRHHTFHVTGVRPQDYGPGHEAAREAARAKLRALLKLGSADYLVGEHPALGGFGHELDGRLFNVDTLKFFEVLVALDRGAVLGELRAPGPRRVVWEIGAGWGGFAYQLKTVCPDVTYVIADLPELFLLSGTYLQTVFPEATIRFWQGEDAGALFAGWEDADFVLVPHFALEALRPPRLDLALNMVSFQEMTTEQVAGYVEHAWELGAPYLYSLNRDRSVYNTELTSVRELIGRRFWVHEVPVLPVPYGKWLHQVPTADKPGRDDYRHVVGWRRSGV